MSSKQEKKIRQQYRREIRQELQHVNAVRREEAQILADHVKIVTSRKPKYMPMSLWKWVIKKVIYR